MRVKKICQGVAFTSAGSATSTPILLIAGNPSADSYWAGQENVPGEDMAFPSSGTAVVALVLHEAVMAAGDTIVVQTSNNYYSDSGSGETFATVKTFTATTTFPGGTAAGSLDNGTNTTIFLDQVPLGEALQIVATLAGSADSGSFSAYLLN